MAVSRNIERARGELTELQRELLQLERRTDTFCGSLRRAISELFGVDRVAFLALREAALAARSRRAYGGSRPRSFRFPLRAIRDSDRP